VVASKTHHPDAPRVLSMSAEKRVRIMSSFRLYVVLSIFAICACLIFSTSPIWAAEVNNLRVGAAKVDITPKDLTGLVSVWAKAFEGVHDPIYARVLVLDNGGTTAAIVALDLVEYGSSMPIRERIARELQIPVDHILVTSSHDHNAPRGGPITAGTSSEQGRPYSTPAYTQQVDDSILDALRRAKASLQPARMGIGTGRADINVNRIVYTPKGWGGGANPDGPSDKTVWVVKFESLSGEPIALLMNYAVHSVVGGTNNALVTGDLAGAVERFVERQFQDKVVALWTMGPAGDQNPKYDMIVPVGGKDQDPAKNKAAAYEVMDALGQVLGVEVVQTANRINRMTQVASIEAAERVVSCPTKPPSPPPAGAPSGQPAGPPAGGMFGPLKGPVPQPIKPLTAMDLRLALIRINQIAITGVSGEVFTNIYWHLKKESPFTNTIMVTMANDRIGYIPDEADYDRIRNASLVRGCAESAIIDNLVKMMNGSIK
jgi:neutral ceramidase